MTDDPIARLGRWRGMLAIGLLYGVLAGIGLLFALVGSNVSPYWPAAGAALALLWRWGPGLWPGLFAGSLAANLVWSHGGLLVSLLIACGSTLGLTTAAALLRRLHCRPELDEPSGPLLLLLVGAGGSAISALIGSLAVVEFGMSGPIELHEVWWTWWTGDTTGVISTTALFAIAWRSGRPDLARWREALLLLLCLVVVCFATILITPASAQGLSPWAFLFFPPLLWAAVRFGPLGTAIAIAMTTAAIAFITASGLGAFADFTDGNRAHLPFQAFTAAAAFTCLVLAAYAASQTRDSAALAESERRYRLVADNARDVVSLHDATGRFTWVSPSVVQILGWRNEDLLGADPRSFLHTDDLDRFPDGQRSTGSEELRFRRPDGSWLWLETAWQNVLGSDGARLGMQMTARDISRRKGAAFAERMASIGTLAGGVAHEFNNLNAVIMGNVELALRKPGLPEDARRRLEQIREAVDREQGVVEALLAFSRHDRGTGEIVELGRVVTTTLALARRTIRQRRVTLQVELPDRPVYAALPHGALGQILLNLLLNACDAVDRRDDPRVRVILGIDSGWAELRVTDNGVGIDPAISARIFEPFFSTKGEHAGLGGGQPWLHGTGLGLSVCRTLADQMGGSITANCTAGEGTTFTVRVPLSESPVNAAESVPLAAICARVLVVDDEPEIRRLLCEHLTGAGHIAVEASEGAQAIAYLDHEDIDLVMLNWSMPGVDGEGFMRHLELHPERRWPPVVVVSGWAGGGSGIDRWRREIAGELRKPFSRDQVRGTVDRVLCGRALEAGPASSQTGSG